MYNFIKSLQIKYFAIVSSDDEFGRRGTEEIKKIIEEDNSQICLARSIVMRTLDDSISIIDTLVDDLQENLNQKNLPLLFIGQYTDAVSLVRSANTREQARRLIWIFPDSVGVDASLFHGYERVGRNAFSISPYYDEIGEFTAYWTRQLYQILHGTANPPAKDPYMKYVENLLKCSMSASTCNSKTQQDIDDAYEQSSFINTVIHSTVAIGKYKAKHSQSFYCRNR